LHTPVFIIIIKPMRVIPLLILIITMLSCNNPGGNEPGSPEQQFGFPGTDETEIVNCSGGSAYVYDDYVVYTTRSEGYPGYDIYVFDVAGEPADPCGMDTAKAYLAITAKDAGGSNFFSGVYEDYLFIDRGTGPSHRMLNVFDMNTRRVLIFTEYTEASVSDDVLTFWDTVQKRDILEGKVSCPEAAEWNKQGLEAVYERKTTLDLKTGLKKPSGDYRCSPAQ